MPESFVLSGFFACVGGYADPLDFFFRPRYTETSNAEVFVMESETKIAVLKRIARRFNEAGLVWALGASMLLYFKQITSEFHDIDLMVADEDAARARQLLCEMGTLQPPNPSSQYKTKCFMEFIIDGVDVDVMAGFAIVANGQTHNCALQKEQIVETLTLDGEIIPLQSAALWRGYYALMGRSAKVEMIDRYLSETRP